TTSPSSSTIPVNMPLHPFASNGSGKRAWSEELRGRSRPWRHQVARHLARPLALPPIRTLTVGTGFPPVQPADGFGRVADCHRRFGLSPTRSTRNDSCLTRLALYLCRVRTHSRCDTSHGLSVFSGAFPTGMG